MRKWELIKQSQLLTFKSQILSNVFNEKYGLRLGEFKNTTGTERVNRNLEGVACTLRMLVLLWIVVLLLRLRSIHELSHPDIGLYFTYMLDEWERGNGKKNKIVILGVGEIKERKTQSLAAEQEVVLVH